MFCSVQAQGHKTFFRDNSAEHEIYPANNTTYIKMPKTVGI